MRGAALKSSLKGRGTVRRSRMVEGFDTTFVQTHLQPKPSRPFDVSSRASEHSPPPSSGWSPSPELRPVEDLVPHLRHHERISLGDLLEALPPSRLAAMPRAHVDLQQQQIAVG